MNLPIPPLRSLSGMTNGARKRALCRAAGLPHLGWMAGEARRRWWDALYLGFRVCWRGAGRDAALRKCKRA